MTRFLAVATLVLGIFGVAAAPALAQCPRLDGKYELGRGWEGAPAPGMTIVSASEGQVVVGVAPGSTLTRVCVKTGNGEDASGDFTIAPSLPVAGPATVTIRSSGDRGSGLSHVTFDTTAPPPPPPPPPPPAAPPPPPAGPFLPPAVCEGLSLSRRTVLVGRRTSVRARVLDQNGAAIAGVRVTARGAGVRASARTGADGLARFTVRPRRVGTIVVRAAGSTVCLARMTAVGRFRPPVPILTG